MNLKNIVAVSGHSGLMELVSTKSNGLILMDPTTKKTKFFSVRLHQFTPLETVGIYTMTDTVDLKVVFEKIMESDAEMPSAKADNQELVKFMGKVLPEFDRDRVYPGDIKKVIKWYNFSKQMGYLDLPEDEVDNGKIVEDTPTISEDTTKPEEKKVKKTKKSL